MISVVWFLAGLGLLVVGAEITVSSASRMAKRLGVSPMVIGLTIVSIGTSAPELAVGIVAGARGDGGLAVGNIAGTNALNLLFIMGLSALVRPLPLHQQIFKLELPVIVLAAALMTFLAWDGTLSALDGGVMLVAGAVYTAVLVVMTRRTTRMQDPKRGDADAPIDRPVRSGWRGHIGDAGLLLVGIVLTVVGADLLVRGAVQIAESFGVSATIIGLTIVAIGTSAPELVTTIVATIKNDRDVAVGNLLGSSIYNILIILGIPCLVTPGGLPVESQLLWVDIPLMAGVAIGAIPVFITGRRISRLEGGLGVAIYLAYLTWLVFFRS